MFSQHSKVIVVSMTWRKFTIFYKNQELLSTILSSTKLKHSWTVESYSTKTHMYEYDNLFI